MAKIYTCPECEAGLERDKFIDNECPECGQAVKFIRKSKGKGTSGFYYECVKASPRDVEPEIRIQSPPAQQDNVMSGSGKLISTPNEIPEIWLVEEGNEDEGIPPKYRMIWSGLIMAGRWIYCPHCDSRLHKNMVFYSGSHADEHMCSTCKSKIELVFDAPGMGGYVRA